MKFIEMIVTNFMPYKGEQTVKFPTDPTRNVLVIYGDNMRGKTSLLNALRWGLYGKAYSRHKAVIGLERLFNIEAMEEGQEEFSVEIKFEADENNYELKRIAKKRAYVAKPESSEDFVIHVFMKKNGQTLAAYQIESEINLYAPEKVSRFFLFDGELLQEYEMLLDEDNVKGQEIKESIEQVLGVPALVHGEHEARTLLQMAEKKQVKELSTIASVNKLAENQRILLEKRDVKLRDLSNAKDQLKHVRDEKNVLDDEIEVLSKQSVLAIELKEKMFRKKTLEDSQIQIREEVLRLSSGSYKALLRPKLLELEFKLSEKIRTNVNKYRNLGVIEKEVEQLSSLISAAICPICSQEIDEKHKHDFNDKLNLLKVQISKIDTDQSDIGQITGQLESLRRLLSSNSVELLKDKHSLERNSQIELTKLDASIDAINKELEGKNENEILRKRKRHDELIRDEQSCLNALEDIESELQKIKKQAEAISQQINSINPDVMSSRASVLVNMYKQLETTFRFSIDALRERLKTNVETNASEAFRELTTQKNYQGLKINSNYGLSIIDSSGRDVPIRSAGAEQIVALSLIDGLSRAGRGAGPVVMDTPFGRLDPKHRQRILQYLPKHASQLVILVHEGEVNKDEDLNIIADRLGGEYEIKELSHIYSKLERQL